MRNVGGVIIPYRISLAVLLVLFALSFLFSSLVFDVVVSVVHINLHLSCLPL